jgi:hypothetical protein
MILFTALLAVISVVVFLCTSRMRTVSRIVLALSIFIVGVLGMIAALIYVGDRPEGCSQNVDVQTGALGPIENCD